MKLDGINLSQVTLLHNSNLKFLEGKMHEPINDIEILYNIERKWDEAQPTPWVLVFEVILALFLLGSVLKIPTAYSCNRCLVLDTAT